MTPARLLQVARIDGEIDAAIGKDFDCVRAFNRAMVEYRSLSESDRRAYVKAYKDAYTKEAVAKRDREAQVRW